jgi:hypothetical protein
VLFTGQTCPGNRSFLAKGRDNRYGARAFATLEGYAGRNRETELALTAESGKTPGHRPGFRLRLERRQTRSTTNRASVRLCGQYAAQGENSPKGLCAAAGTLKGNGICGKEFQFAHI